MPTTSLIVLSDLHLTDNRTVLEGFRPSQQAALEGLLRAALPGGSLGNPSSTLLIINGDCFDFLAVPPYPADGFSTPLIALEKLEKIAAAHKPFFSTLRNFLDQGGGITFLFGNHDIELCFAEVRTRVAQLIDSTNTRGERLQFCLDQRYQPAPDIVIEHGNQYDFWNYASGIWDNAGKALAPEMERIELPLGTQYMHLASLPMSLRYPYFERFDPPSGIARQVALLCLLDPALVIATAQKLAAMMPKAHQPLQNLAPSDELIPARLFTQAMTDFATFQQAMLARSASWPDMEKHLYHANELAQKQADTLSTFLALREALEKGPTSALQAICAPHADSGDEDTTRGMHLLLREQSGLRVAIAGHTHITRADRVPAHGQLYLNTATWTQRLAPPTFDELTPALMDWLRNPNLESAPLANKTAYVFAWVSTEAGQPSTAHLCEWEGGHNGQYRVL